MSSEKSRILDNAQQYTIRGQIQKAIEEWKKLLTNLPNDANIYNTIGDLSLKNSSSTNSAGEAVSFYVKAAEIFESSGFALKAIAVYKKILKITPNNKEIYLRLGNLDCERGLIGNARENYLLAAKLYTQDGFIKEALEVYRKIADLDPSNLSVRTKIAEMFMKEGMKNEAIGEYKKIAGEYLKAGSTDDAEKIYDLILDLQPDNISAIVEAGRFHLENGNIESAIEYGKRAYSLSPDSQDVLLLLVDSYNSAAIFDKAEEILLKVIELNPGDLPFREILAAILFNKGDIGSASNEYFEVGKEYLDQRNIEKARLMAEKAEEISPDMINVQELLFDIYLISNRKEDVIGKGLFLARHFEELGQVEDAREYYLKILKEDPFNVEAKERLDETEVKKSVFQITETEEDAEEIPGKYLPVSPDKTIEITEQLSSADVYIKYGLMEKAIAELQNIISNIDPMNEPAHIKLKDIYRIMGEKEKVVEECLVLINIFETSGESEKIEKIINEVSEISPDDKRIKVYIDKRLTVNKVPENYNISELLEEARFYEQQGMHEEAINVYEKVLCTDSNNAEAIRQVGLLTNSGYKVSFPEVEIIQPKKQSSESFFDLGEVLKEDLAGGPPDKPIDEIFKEFHEGIASQLGSEDYESHYDLGISYKEMNLFREAIGEFIACGRITPRFLDASYMIALCHKELGEYKEAIEILNNAITSDQYNDKRHLALKYEIGTLLEMVGKKDEALRVYKQVYNSDPFYRDISEKVLNLQRRALS